MSAPADEAGAPAVASSRRAHGQLILCQGCCCGRTDRGFPEVPIDSLKKAWKAGRLNRTVQLTVSGCVGPCDVANVVVVVTAEGTSWYGRLESAHYDALLAWAESCHAVGAILPLPEGLSAHRFDWFIGAPGASLAPAADTGSLAP